MRVEVDIIHLLACGRSVLTFQSILPPPSSGSIHIYQTTRRQISEDGSFCKHECYNQSTQHYIQHSKATCFS